jgi:hypothetical protein
VTKGLTDSLSLVRVYAAATQFLFAKLQNAKGVCACNKVSRIEPIQLLQSDEHVNDLGVVTKCEHDEIKIIDSI